MVKQLLKKFVRWGMVAMWLVLGVVLYAQSTHIITSGTLPTNCTVGDIYYKTGTSAGFYTCSTTDTWTAAGSGGGSSSLSGITAATTSNTIANGNNSGQVWNWALTSNSVTAFQFGETTAATSGTGDSQVILGVNALASSTAIPLYVKNYGNADSFRVDDVSGDTTPFIVDSSGVVNIGSGSVVTPGGVSFTLQPATPGGNTNGGSVTITSGSPGGFGNGGSLTLKTGDNNGNSSGAGSITIQTGNQSASNAGHGTISILGGRNTNTPNANGISGVPIVITSGPGQGIHHSGTGTGGTGGAVTITAGDGGAAAGLFGGSGIANGGAGGVATLAGGAGAAATVSGATNGGAGGDVVLTTGAGGAGTTATGSPGNIVFKIAGTEWGRINSSGNVLFSSLKTTGSAGSKMVVCVDTATGQLYASSTSTDCSN